ncbi:MAG: hypothetical protein H6Q30_2656 [Bacteroidetes bacterium]|nr:hypothetical protein [Bacteroidota bacterium]
MEFFIHDAIPFYAKLALAICILGMALRFSRYFYNRMTMKREMTPRTPTPYPAKGKSILGALWAVNVQTFTKFWLKANPITALGHVVYHVGFFTAMGIYGLVAILSLDKLAKVPLHRAILMVADWFNFKIELFGTSGFYHSLGEFLTSVFLVALLLAVPGIMTPFVMSILGKRGMIRPVDSVAKALGITSTPGLTTRNSIHGWERKILGVGVLVMDCMMLFTLLFPVGADLAYIIHATFGLTIIASLPFSFLFHEIYRLRMWGAVRRLVDGRTT